MGSPVDSTHAGKQNEGAASVANTNSITLKTVLECMAVALAGVACVFALRFARADSQLRATIALFAMTPGAVVTLGKAYDAWRAYAEVKDDNNVKGYIGS